MARKKKDRPEEPSNLYHTMAQNVDAQKASRQLSEIQDLKQHPDAPKISGYMLVKPIGRGAYAEVWEAIQIRTRKFVAVKVFTKKSGVHWFYLQREADRLIRLDKHPHIVSLLDADLSGDPPYYVMDLAQDGSLEKFLEDGKQKESQLGVEEVVTWMEEIAQALNYVHAKQMVHCDLKPANVLLDDEGHVRVADFGNSRILSESGGALGTLFFMAPEQALLPDPEKPLQPDARWDIYALGCTIYSVLAHHTPHEEISDKLQMTGELSERLRIYRQAIENQPLQDLFTLTRGKVDRDLSAIIDKCVKTKPEERYHSIAEVLKDLKARHEGRPVSPLVHDKAYWIGKFVKRYQTSVLIAGFSLVAVLAAFHLVSQRQKEQIQDTAFNYVLRGREFLDKNDEASAAAYFTASNKLSPSLLARGNAMLHMPPIPVQFFAHDGGIVAAAYSPGGKFLLTAGGASGAKLWNAKTGQATSRSFKLGGTMTAAVFSPDGSKLALGDSGGEARVYDVATQKAIGKEMDQDKEITSIAFSPDGRKLVTASLDGTARIWNTATGEPAKAVARQSQGIFKASFSPDGSLFLTASKDGTARLWGVDDGKPACDPVKLEIKNAPSWYKPDVDFNPNGRYFLTTGWDGSVRFYDLRGRRKGRVLFLEGIGARAVFSPDGNKFLTSVMFEGAVGLARVWKSSNRNPLKFTLRNTSRIAVLAFNSDGSQILLGGTDHMVRVWDAETGKPQGRPLCHGDLVTAAAFDPNGQTLLTGTKDGLARLWRPLGGDSDDMVELEWKKSGREHFKKLHSHAVFSPDLKKALTYGGKTACLWDTATGEPMGPVLVAGGTILRAVFDPTGSSLLTCDGDAEARFWDLATGKSKSLAHDGAVRGGAFSADGKKILTGGEDKTLRLWDSSRGQEWGKPLNTGLSISKALLSANGERMAALGDKGGFRLYTVEKSNPKVLFKADKGVKSAAFSQDSQSLLLTTGETATLLDARSGKVLQSFKHGMGLNSALISPDNRTLATLGGDGVIRLWDATTGLPIGNPLKHEGSIQETTFSPHGGALLVAYQDGGWELWDTKTGEAIGEEVFQGTLARTIGFEPSGRNFSILGQDGGVARMDADWVDPQMDPNRLLLTAQVAGWCRVNDQGSLEPVSTDQWVRLWNQYRKDSK